jgi:hypothetical protein
LILDSVAVMVFDLGGVSLIADNWRIRHCLMDAATIFRFFSGAEIGPEHGAGGNGSLPRVLFAVRPLRRRHSLDVL